MEGDISPIVLTRLVYTKVEASEKMGITRSTLNERLKKAGMFEQGSPLTVYELRRFLIHQGYEVVIKLPNKETHW